MAIIFPHTFGYLSGQIPLSFLDDNFNAINSGIANTAGSFKNALINGNFSINQLAVSGTVTLSAGVYGHDGFKAGAGGCTYTFATVVNLTTLTITAGTLQQVANGKYLQSGTYTLGWNGTAQARIDSGGYGASPQSGTAVGGTNQTCEWGTGTLSLPQYEPGAIRTSFEFRDDELIRCRKYYKTGQVYFISPGISGTGFGYASEFGNPMDSVPTIAYTNISYISASGLTASSITASGFASAAIASATTTVRFTADYAASARL